MTQSLKEAIEPPHVAYRNSMVDYAKANESKETAEKVERWHELTQQFIKRGSIKESDQGKEFVDIGLTSVSKLVHDSVVINAFKEGEYTIRKYTDHQGTLQPCIEVSLDALDAFMDDPHKSFEGTNELMSEEDLNIMLAWIGEKYKTDNNEEQMYIFQMINPDVLGHGWMKDTDGYYRSRSYLVSFRLVGDRNVIKLWIPNSGCSLSLVQKC